jgi:hypothetical protein
VEYGRIVREAWSITARTRALWWLGAISAAQLVVYTVMVIAVVVPMTALPQIAYSTTAVESGFAVGTPSPRAQQLLGLAQWMGAHFVAITLGVLAVCALWLVLGVFDVAAQTGMVTQVNAVAARRSASVGAGLSDGFRLWWRAVSLLALAALPALVYLLIMAIVMFFTISLPLFLGTPPKAGAALIANLAISPLSGLVSLLSVPLGVLVQLALRFAFLDELPWRPAFGAAWRLAKRHFVEILLTYAVIALMSAAALTVFAALAAVVSGLASVLVLGGGLLLSAGNLGASGRAAGFGAIGVAGLLLLAFQAVLLVWQSAVWTLVWRDRSGKHPDSGADTNERAVSRGYAASTTEGSV